MPGFDFQWTFDASGPIELFGEILPRTFMPALKLGAARAAIRLQNMMRDELDRMIYDTPESPNYKRTGTLRRATYAARPGANHSRDHDAAFAGVDLGQHAGGGGGGIVSINGFEASVDIGSWADWAYYVHEGLGMGPRIPKPFTRRPAEEADNIMREEINNSLAEMLIAVIR